MENWREDALPEHTHDPNEVTVQIDGVGRQLAELAAESDQDGPDGPVFVDETGRRSRRYRRIGVFVGIACAVYAVIIVATLFSGNSSAPWLPIDPKDEKPASKVDTPSRPADSLDPAASPGATPSPGASESGTAPATGDDGEPDPSKTDDGKVEPGDSTGPGPTDDGGKPDPDPTDDGGNPDPSDDPTKPDPDPDPTDDPTTPDPDPSTESPGAAAGGGGEAPMQPVTDQQSSQRAQSVGYQSPRSSVDQQPSEGAQR